MITKAVTNQKGGIGKKALSFNLAYILTGRKDTKVCAIDNDPQGNLTSSFIEDPASLTANLLDANNDKLRQRSAVIMRSRSRKHDTD